MKPSVLCLLAVLLFAPPSSATPSTILWIPSTDIQGKAVWHVGVDNYFSTFKKSPANGGAAFPTDLGLTVGVFSSPLLAVEIGADLCEPSDSPWLLNAKAAVPEGSLWASSPSITAGMMNIGFQKDVTDANVMYGLVAKNFAFVGRLTVGYFSGNPAVLTYGAEKQNAGLLASWDRQMTEISEKLWLAADYQSGKSAMGMLSVGGSWAFTENIGFILGYNFYNNNSPSTLTIQLDISLS